MKTVLVFSICIVTLVCSFPHDKRGSCLLLCGDSVNRACPTGYECKSNGCGSECYMTNIIQPAGCADFHCAYHCPLGYKHDASGCLTCKCDYSSMSVGRK